MSVYKVIVVITLFYFLAGCGSESVTPISQKQMGFEWSHRGDLSGNGDTVAVIQRDRTVSVWDSSGAEIYSIPHNKMYGEAYEIDIANNADKLAIANPMGISVFKLSSGTLLEINGIEAKSDGAGISDVTLSDDGNILGIGFTDGVLLLKNLNTGKYSWYEVAKSKVRILTFDDKGKFAFTGSVDGTVSMIDMGSGKVRTITSGGPRITSLAYNPETNSVFYSNSMDENFIVNAQSGEQIESLSFMERFKYFRDSKYIGNLLLTGTSKTSVYLWDNNGNERFHIALGGNHLNTRLQSAMTDKEGNIVTLGSTGVIEKWKLKI